MRPLLLLLISFHAWTATAQTPARIVRVLVQTDERGEPGELAERKASRTDLATALTAKPRTIAVVTRESDAQAVLEVLSRGVTVPKVVIGLGARPGQPGASGPVRTAVLRVRMTWGEDSVVFTNKNKPAESPRGWKSAADDIGDQVEAWLTKRRAGADTNR